MAYFLAEGSKFLFSQTLATAVNVTAATNADPAVLTTGTAHGYSNGDELLFTSGWEDATDSIWRASAASGSTVTLSSLDSSDTTWFPVGTGTGTLRKFSNWVEIGQVLDSQASGGDARNVTIEPLSRRNGINMPAGFNPSSLNLTLGYDPSTSAQIALNKISRNLSARIGFKFQLAGGQTGYGYGTAQLSQMPAIAKGSAVSVNLTINFLGAFVGYAS